METAYNDLPLEVERKLDMENELTVLEKKLAFINTLGYTVMNKDVIESDIEWLKSELGIG
tara:strand:+ start:344 stop:523 length:180 start_codon:yes stop_codon:yes gene_type:complete